MPNASSRFGSGETFLLSYLSQHGKELGRVLRTRISRLCRTRLLSERQAWSSSSPSLGRFEALISPPISPLSVRSGLSLSLSLSLSSLQQRPYQQRELRSTRQFPSFCPLLLSPAYYSEGRSGNTHVDVPKSTKEAENLGVISRSACLLTMPV